jgi:hypothetical protein
MLSALGNFWLCSKLMGVTAFCTTYLFVSLLKGFNFNTIKLRPLSLVSSQYMAE